MEVALDLAKYLPWSSINMVDRTLARATAKQVEIGNIRNRPGGAYLPREFGMKGRHCPGDY